MIEQVYRHDRVRTGQSRGEDYAQPDSSATKDNQRLADLYFGIVIDDAESSDERVGEKGRYLEIEILWNNGKSVLRYDRQLIEGRNPSGFEVLSAPTVNGRLHLQSLGGTPVQHDGIASADPRYPGPHFLDYAAAFVAK